MIIDKELYNKVSDITGTDYHPIEVLGTMCDDKFYIERDSIVCMLGDLLYEVDYRQEQIEDLEQDIQDNYKPITKEEMYLG